MQMEDYTILQDTVLKDVKKYAMSKLRAWLVQLEIHVLSGIAREMHVGSFTYSLSQYMWLAVARV